MRSVTHLIRILIASLAALIVPAGSAHAHLIGTRFGDFYAGAFHPLTDLNDVVLWIALGLLAGSLGAPRSRWLVVLFPIGLVAGFALAIADGTNFSGDVANATLIALLGLVLAAGLRLPAPLLGIVAFALAVTRGIANAAAVEPATNLVLFGAGLACAGYATMTLTMAIVVAFRRSEAGAASAWRGIALRALGGWIAAIGLMMVGFTLAGPGAT
ncbi:hypothetical protein G8O24_19900 [Bradyrhizobium sp. INPA01-394B]|uniref:HupE/UreJ family protein n=1 Tax=Bradyrhizobium campsiandrae TaxID=1729892 RepID=A0ABR7UBJ9_9BRAD|nr:HupE/UreJ family protein [Bradyrhizobium campsiandrae]MBC9879608.1 hypothetical protein [Bradyrhizobium campsiandrae]MBC9980787.1 HupE/UreJ family protein [Bradyrhizobium campsiandrae]